MTGTSPAKPWRVRLAELLSATARKPPLTVPLQSAPPDKSRVTVTVPLDSPPITVTCAGADSLFRPGGPKAVVLSVALQVAIFEYHAPSAVWYQLLHQDFPLSGAPAATEATT